MSGEAVSRDPAPEPRGEPEPEPPAPPAAPPLLPEISASRASRIAVVGLFILALFVTLYVARVIVLPIVLALLFSFLLAPVVRVLRRVRIPRTLASALVVGGFVAVAGTGIYYLGSPAADWMERAPQTLRKAETKLRQLKEPVEKVNRATQEVERITDMSGSRSRQPEVEVRSKPLSSSVAKITFAVVSTTLVTLVLIFFLLATGETFLRKMVEQLPTLSDKKRGVEIARRVERSISTYLVTVTAINATLGVAVWGALWYLGMPNPVLWGVMAGLLNFVPYLGAMVGTAVISLVAFMSFEELGAALLPPLAYLALTALEGSLLTPTILGKRLTLNPLVIFVGIIFWGWMWGVVGALLAVPLLATFKIFCDNIPVLKPLGEMMGE